jgi:hypothetical protein
MNVSAQTPHHHHRAPVRRDVPVEGLPKDHELVSVVGDRPCPRPAVGMAGTANDLCAEPGDLDMIADRGDGPPQPAGQGGTTHVVGAGPSVKLLVLVLILSSLVRDAGGGRTRQSPGETAQSWRARRGTVGGAGMKLRY